MKTLAILFLLCASVHGAITNSTNVVGDITTKVLERTAEEGKPDLHIETVYRGKTKVMMIMSRRNQNGVLAVTSRCYLAGGKLVMVESDEDGDGVFESLTVFNPDTEDFEKFIRQPDGSVKPMSTQSIDATKRMKAVADESLRTLLQNPDMTNREVEDLLEKNRQKIEAIKKKKPDGKN